MPYSYSQTVGTGATNILPLPCPALRPIHYHVTDNGVEIAQSSLVISGGSCTLPQPASAYPGHTLRIYRITPVDAPQAVFLAGGLDPSDVNLDVLQLLYSLQESADAAGDNRTLYNQVQGQLALLQGYVASALESASSAATSAATAVGAAGSLAAIVSGALYLESYVTKGDPSTAVKTANAAGMAQLFTDIEASGKYLEMRTGDVYLPAGKISKTFSKKLIMSGRGEESVRFIWPTGVGGFEFTYSDVTKPPKAEGFSLLTGQTTGGAGRALAILTAPATIVPYKGPHVENVRAKGTDDTGNSAYWDAGIYMEEVWYPRIVNPGFNGKAVNVPPFLAAAGIRLKNVQAPIIRDPLVFWASSAILMEGDNWLEGAQISGGELVGVTIGINDQCTFLRSGTAIHDLHINAYQYGIISQLRSDLDIHDCLIFKTNLSTLNWIGVQVLNASRLNFHDNGVGCPGCTSASGTANGLLLGGGGDNHYIRSNRFFNWGGQAGVAVLGDGTVDYCFIDGNSRYDGGPASMRSNVGANTVISNNLPNNT